MLSNTAVPKYYGEFREKVIRGEIPICREIEMEMNRIDALIANPCVYYDPDPVEGFIAFCESELTLPDGQPMTMLPSFKLWAEQLRGWYEFVIKTVPMPNPNGAGTIYVKKRIRKRLTTKQFIVAGRGSAKTIYLEDNQAYELVVNGKTTHGITMAPFMRQAEEVINPINTALLRGVGPIFKFMGEGSIQNTTGARINRPKLAHTKKGMQNFMTNSILEIRAMNIDAAQSFRGAFASVDEWRSCDIREDVTTALEQGTSKNDDWWIIETSSEGTIRNAIGDEMGIELKKILKGEIYNPHISIWWYKLDDVKEVADPNMWVKANPNIGLTVSYDTYQEDKNTAENVPEKRNDILAKRFGLPVEGYTYYFTYEETLPTGRDLTFWQLPCAVGFDLSRGDDFCAATFLFPRKDQIFGVRTLCFISSRTLNNLPLNMRNKYESFIAEGSLMVLEGVTLDLIDVYDCVEQYIMENQYAVCAVGYDPYAAEGFIQRWVNSNGPHGVVKVIQGRKTESVPLGEIKKLTADRRLIFDQKLMTFCLGNCIVNVDINNNKMLDKKRDDQKIDAVAALLDAYVAYKANEDEFL